MKRDLDKVYNDYLKSNRAGQFGTADYEALVKASNGSQWDLISRCLGVGVMIGYQMAIKEQRKKG